MGAERVPRTTPARGPNRSLAIVVHAAAVATFANAFRVILDTTGPMSEFLRGSFGGHWQFLTIISLLGSLVMMSVALLADLLPGVRALHAIKNALGTLVVPVEGLVSILYWSILTYDPNLMVPPDIKEFLPFWLDLSIHVAPAVFLWIDFLVLSPQLSRATRPYTLITLATVAYCIWLETCTAKNGRAVYPFLDPSILSTPARVGVYLGSLGLAFGLFEASRAIHRAVHGPSSRSKIA